MPDTNGECQLWTSFAGLANYLVTSELHAQPSLDVCRVNHLPSCQIRKLSANQVPLKCRPSASHGAPADRRRRRLSAKMSLRSNEALFVTSQISALVTREVSPRYRLHRRHPS